MAANSNNFGVFVVALASLASSTSAASAASVIGCGVNGHESGDHVTGVSSTDMVRFAWMLSSPEKNVIQSSFHLTIEGTGVSPKGDSAEQTYVLNGGEASLKPGTSYSYTISAMVNGSLSAFDGESCTGSFETAPAGDVFPGTSAWIGGGGILHSTNGITIPSSATVSKARAYVSGVGAFYFFINGKKVGENIMDPPQTVYSKRVLYEAFDIANYLKPGANSFAALLGNYKFGYTDIWCNMTAAGGPDGCRVFVATIAVTLSDGSSITLRSTPSEWVASPGPVTWDHFFHGETYDARVPIGVAPPNATPAKIINPPSGYPKNMGVFDHAGKAISLGQLNPTNSPPLRVVKKFAAVSVSQVHAMDVDSTAFVFDFGQNMAGMTTLSLPQGHGLAAGTQLRIELAEIITGEFIETGNLCKLCPNCEVCQGHLQCASNGVGAVCDTYCSNPAMQGGVNNHTLRHEPCFPHQSYGKPHETPDRYIGDFNNANQTNVYIVGEGNKAETYTPFFAGGGFRYAQLSGLPSGFQVSTRMLTGLMINSNVSAAAEIVLPVVTAPGGTTDVLNKIHAMTLASQLSNLWSIPTDCPQRERRGWMGDAQSSSNEAMLNFNMQQFYENFLEDIRNDQLRFNGNNVNDTGALADVVPYDGIGGNPGCPVWQVAYIVIARNMWKHYGSVVLPVLASHYIGLSELMGWFNRHADPSDGLLVTPCYGDWMGFNPASGNHGGSSVTPSASVTAFHHVLAMQYMETIATALGKPSEASKWSQMHANALKAYHARYYNATVGGYNPIAPAGNVLPPHTRFINAGPDVYFEVTAQKQAHHVGSCNDCGLQICNMMTPVTKAYLDTLKITSPFICSMLPGGGGGGASSHTGFGYNTSVNGSQTSNAMALMLGAPPTAAIANRVALNLANDVAAFDDRTTTGVSGIGWLFPALDAFGQSARGVGVLQNDQYPSIGFMASQNMTTLCENLACTFHDAGGGSQNHIMLGAFDAWISSSFGGLDSVVSGTTAGWREIEVRVAPAAITSLMSASVVRQTVLGQASLDWKYTNSKFLMNLTVPVGSVAHIHTPATLLSKRLVMISEQHATGSNVLWTIDSTKVTATSSPSYLHSLNTIQGPNNAVVATVGSGSYLFEAEFV